ncbi:AMP-binding protein [Nocardiopsis sp. L17-MgMaSL7]|uniref:non-ribosomal peptide synthetase n=1 Tax=Nocardiopsis sp. L17-MgMaSL7 TaxID=1938893 RepID=UPI000D9556AE|nr:AMP-binding protein [Nocardiopsis sp. L17-MgMaSL7]PWV47943.1 non-ribosomal peptide synthetase component F [Nocardiopsis sp. L17-MgMaSL7]
MTQPTSPAPGTPAAPGAIADVLPLSPLQEGLLFHHALDGGETDVYGIQLRVELLGRIDTERLRRAASALLDRHPNLRAGFLHEELDQPVQFVPAETDLDWTHTDLTKPVAGAGTGSPNAGFVPDTDSGSPSAETVLPNAEPVAGAGTVPLTRESVMDGGIGSPNAEPVSDAGTGSPNAGFVPDTDSVPLDAEDRVAEREFARGFDLSAPPLIRFHALTTGPDRTVLVITAHHVLLDGWSLPILARDLLRLYEADGDGGALPAAPRYRNHLAWLNGRDHDSARKAWAAALEGLPGPTLLAPGRMLGAEEPGTGNDPSARTGSPESAAASVESRLGTTASQRLRALAADTGVTVNTVLQVTWALTLAVHTGREDVVFGQPVSGRTPELPGAHETVGLFTNTLPVRVRLDPAEPLADLLTRTRVDQADLLDHQWTGLAEVQRAAGHGTLFDTLLVVENYPLDEAAARADHAGIRAGDIRVRDATHYPATLTVLPDDGPDLDTVLRLDHLPGAVHGAAARQLLDLFTRLLGQVCADPRRTPRELDLLTPAQRTELASHNGTAHPTTHSTLNALLAAAEREHQDRPAVVTEDRELTYRQLHDDAARLAGLLREHGVGPESVVAVALPRGADLVTAFVAVVRAGGVLLPLDLDHPPARLADMAERAGAVAVVTTSGQRADLADLPADTARIELDAPETRDRLAALPPLTWAQPHPDQLAYTLFTSGSTGRPKGVGVSHRAITNRIEWTQAAYALTPEDRVAQKTPVGFDVSVWEFLWPLAVGAAVVPARPDGHRDPAYLVGFLASQRVTVCHFVPAMLRLFLDELPAGAGPGRAPVTGSDLASAGRPDPASVPGSATGPLSASATTSDPVSATTSDPEPVSASAGTSSSGAVSTVISASATASESAPVSALRLVIASGEALGGDLAHAFAAALPATRLENLYGPTEAAVDVTSHPAAAPGADPAPEHLPGGPVPIGHPVWNTTAHVLDHALRPVPPEAVGELYLGGVQLARGYVGRPDLTASRFVADPSGPAGARLYRTGDLVRRRADGALVYLGRSDDQVKINGVRVEPGEAEAVLRALNGVADAAVTVRTARSSGVTALAGYVVPAPRHTPDPDQLRAQLATALPPALVPATVAILDRLPLSVNGKLDRGALPDPVPAAASGRPPATEAELVLASAVADLLGVAGGPVPADADFFTLGGDSVTSIRLVGRARAAGLELTVRDVFTHRTPERLAAHAARSADQERSGPGSPDPADPGPEPAPAQGEEFADLLDAGDMDQLQQLWDSRD